MEHRDGHGYERTRILVVEGKALKGSEEREQRRMNSRDGGMNLGSRRASQFCLLKKGFKIEDMNPLHPHEQQQAVRAVINIKIEENVTGDLFGSK